MCAVSRFSGDKSEAQSVCPSSSLNAFISFLVLFTLFSIMINKPILIEVPIEIA